MESLYGPVINFEILHGVVDGERANTLFVGGESDGHVIGRTSIFPNLIGMDHGLVYVTDTWRDKDGNWVAQPPYVVAQTLGHEMGHFLTGMAESDAGVGGGNDHEKDVALLAKYNLDPDQHDLTGPYMMAKSTGDYSNPTFYRFSASSAAMVTDNLNFDNIDVDPEEYGEGLRQANTWYGT